VNLIRGEERRRLGRTDKEVVRWLEYIKVGLARED